MLLAQDILPAATRGPTGSQAVDPPHKPIWVLQEDRWVVCSPPPPQPDSYSGLPPIGQGGRTCHFSISEQLWGMGLSCCPCSLPVSWEARVRGVVLPCGPGRKAELPWPAQPGKRNALSHQELLLLGFVSRASKRANPGG